jgi:pimeloyl-ACP methyl ester carboxylesterase
MSETVQTVPASVPAPEIRFRMIETNGVALHVADAGDAANPLVVLLHGFPEFWYGWRHQIPYLAARGYHVIAPDQRGYNLSEKPAGLDAYALDTLADDIAGLIVALGREHAYVVGHDWGAAVAWHLALRHPARVRKLAILNVPHPHVMRRTLANNPAQMLRSWYIGFFQLPGLPELLLTGGDAQGGIAILQRTSNPGSFTDSDVPRYIRAWKQPGAATAMLNWYRSIVQRPVALPADIRVHQPVMIIWGRNDVALTPQMAHESVALCDDARLIVFEDATHWVQHDKAHEVNVLLEDFLMERVALEPVHSPS